MLLWYLKIILSDFIRCNKSLTSKENHNMLDLFARHSLNHLNNKQENRQIALTFENQNFSSSRECKIHTDLVSSEFLGAEGAHAQGSGTMWESPVVGERLPRGEEQGGAWENRETPASGAERRSSPCTGEHQLLQEDNAAEAQTWAECETNVPSERSPSSKACSPWLHVFHFPWLPRF